MSATTMYLSLASTYSRSSNCMRNTVCLGKSIPLFLYLRIFLIGPIVRITPREVSVSDLDFLDTVYAPGAQFKRDKDSEKVKALGISTSIGGAVEHDLHRRRRDSLNPFFSKKNVMNLAPQIQVKTALLHDIFATSFSKNEIVNLSDLYFAFASE